MVAPKTVIARQSLDSGFKNCHSQAKLGSGFKNCQRQAKLVLFTEWSCDRQTEDFLSLQSIQLLTVYDVVTYSATTYMSQNLKYS